LSLAVAVVAFSRGSFLVAFALLQVCCLSVVSLMWRLFKESSAFALWVSTGLHVGVELVCSL